MVLGENILLLLGGLGVGSLAALLSCALFAASATGAPRSREKEKWEGGEYTRSQDLREGRIRVPGRMLVVAGLLLGAFYVESP